MNALQKGELKKQIHQRWEEISDWWSEMIGSEGDFSRRAIILPQIEAVLPNISRMKILDAGCGEGYLCRWLSSRGADLTGVDFSGGLIDHARQKNGSGRITYLCDDVEKLNSLERNDFNSCFCINVLMDLASPQIALRVFNEKLIKGSMLIVVIPHTGTFGPGGVGLKLWHARRIYFDNKEALYTTKIDGNSPVRTYYFHRPSDWYTHYMSHSGFAVVKEMELYSNVSGGGDFWKMIGDNPVFSMYVLRKS